MENVVPRPMSVRRRRGPAGPARARRTSKRPLPRNRLLVGQWAIAYGAVQQRQLVLGEVDSVAQYDAAPRSPK